MPLHGLNIFSPSKFIHFYNILTISIQNRLFGDRGATLRLGGGGGGGTISDSILRGGGTINFFLLNLYNFKNIGGVVPVVLL